MESVLDAEKPDFVIFTGDIAATPVKGCWKTVSKPVIDRKIFWSYVNGNHDEEYDMDRSEIIKFLQTLPYFIGENGDENISGYGNFTIELNENNSDKIAAVLYMMDSNSYPDNEILGNYDWIKHDQVHWYYNTSLAYESRYKRKLPALGFFHIPLPEYDILVKNKEYIGSQGEKVCSPDINSGLFSVFVEREDMMGIFVGHDHNNDYIGLVNDIALAYGRVTGTNAYGKMDRGGRVIELEQGKREFVTWIRTPKEKLHLYHYPDNELYDKTLPHIKAEKSVKTKQGINYTYHEGEFNSVNEMSKKNLVGKGTSKTLSLNSANSRENFGFIYTGMLDIPKSGNYKFTLTSDDGSVFFINNQEIINNDGNHSPVSKKAGLKLDKGLYNYKLMYYNKSGGSRLELKVKSLTIDEQEIPKKMLVFPKK